MRSSIYVWISRELPGIFPSDSLIKNPHVFPFACVLHGPPVISSSIVTILTVFGELLKLCIYFPPSSYDTASTDTESTCFSGFGLILMIYCLFISAIGFCELFARQIGKKSPYERQMTNEYLLCGLPYKAGAISCV